MKRAGILVLVTAFAATGCTTRRGGTIGMGVGMGMLLAGAGVLAASPRDENNNNQVALSGPEYLTVWLVLGGLAAGLSGIVVAGAPDPKDLPPPPHHYPRTTCGAPSSSSR